MSDLEKMSVGEINEQIAVLSRDLFNMRMHLGIGDQVKTDLFAKIRKQIARCKTAIAQREIS